jgi:hypothetical protein
LREFRISLLENSTFPFLPFLNFFKVKLIWKSEALCLRGGWHIEGRQAYRAIYSTGL